MKPLLADVAVLALVFLLVVGAALPGEEPGRAFTAEFNPGAVVVDECKSTPPDTFVAYTADGRVDLLAVDMWMGIYKGAFYDATVVVDIWRGGAFDTRAARFSWDRYADPDGLHHRFLVFPEPFSLAAGDQLIVYAKKCHVAGEFSPLHPIVLFYLEK